MLDFINEPREEVIAIHFHKTANLPVWFRNVCVRIQLYYGLDIFNPIDPMGITLLKEYFTRVRLSFEFYDLHPAGTLKGFIFKNTPELSAFIIMMSEKPRC